MSPPSACHSRRIAPPAEFLPNVRLNLASSVPGMTTRASFGTTIESKRLFRRIVPGHDQTAWPCRSSPISRSATRPPFQPLFGRKRKTKSYLRAPDATLFPACQSGMKQNPEFRRDYRGLVHRSTAPFRAAGPVCPRPCGSHLGKIGCQYQWPFLRNFKRKRLTSAGAFEPRRVWKKNRLGIKEIRFLCSRLSLRTKKIKNSLDSMKRQVAVA